jgi:hypothetical protein
MVSKMSKRKAKSPKSKGVLSPFPPLRRGGRKKQLSYTSLDGKVTIPLHIHVEPLHGKAKKGEEQVYSAPNLVWTDKQGRDVKFLSYSVESGEPLPAGSTKKAWLRKDTRKEVEAVDPSGQVLIDTATGKPLMVDNPAFGKWVIPVDKDEIQTFQVQDDGTRVAYEYPSEINNLTVATVMEEEYAEEYLYEEKVWQVWELDAKGKRTPEQKNLQKLAEELYFGYGARTAQKDGRDPNVRKGFVGVIPNLLLSTPSIGKTPQPRVGIVSVVYDEDDKYYHVMLRVTNREIEPYHLPIKAMPSPTTAPRLTKPITKLKELQ